MKLTTKTVAELKACLNPNNPRWMSDEDKEALRRSLSTFGIVEPVVFNSTTKQVVGGHQRIGVAEELGIETLPVMEIAITEIEEAAMNLSLNKISGEWDLEKLAVILSEFEGDAVELTGYTRFEADAVIASYTVDPNDIIDKDDIEPDKEEKKESEPDETLAIEKERITFGQFSRQIPREIYNKWVEGLIAESPYGDSPIHLGHVVADKLNIKWGSVADAIQSQSAVTAVTEPDTEFDPDSEAEFDPEIEFA